MKTLKILALSFLLLFQTPDAKAGWWDDFVDWIMSPVRPVWGKYSEGGSTNRYPPLTTFDRGPDVYWEQREKIRNNIKLTDDPLWYKRIYQKIYANAQGSTSSKCGDNGVCTNANIAKDAAFVYLMGFDDNGNDLDGSGDPGRQFFYDKAVDVLKRDDDWWGGFGGIGNQQFRAKELIELLQAHDYLMTTKGAGINSYGAMEDVRDALADFTYDLYGRGNNLFGSLDRYNNLTLLVAGAVGMAACVLSDKETYFWRIQKKPERWANAAHAYTNRTLWTGPSVIGSTIHGSKGPMSKDGGDCKNCVYGYAEGPGYFQYGFENLLPFFISFQNFVNRDMTGKYYTSALNFFGEDVRNYVYNPAFEQNLYKWYNDIKMPNGDCPTYDDTWGNFNMSGILALTRKKAYNTVPFYSRLQLDGLTSMQLREDYLAAFTYPTPTEYNNTTAYDLSGDLVVRNNTGDLPTEHYIHVNAKGLGSSLNGYRPLNQGHEHGDVGNFIIAAGEDVLAIDPAYYGWDNRNDIHDGDHHNVITIDGEGPDPEDGVRNNAITFLYPNGNGYKIELKYKYWNYVLGWPTSPKAELKRTVEVYDEGNIRYYQINDEVKNKNWFNAQWVQFNLNGNGNQDDGTYFPYPGKDNSVVWNHPCHKDNDSNDNWKMQASLTTFLNGTSASNIIATQNGSTHGNYGGDNNLRYNPNLGSSNNFKSGFNAEIGKPETIGGNKAGHHSRMTKQLSILPDEVAHFKTTIQVLGCADNTPPPLMVMNDRYTSHLMSLNTTKEHLFNFHFSRINQSSVIDTVVNPLQIDANAILETNAKSIFFSYSTEPEFKSGNCISYCNFRKGRMVDGRLLSYHDTTYIESTKFSEAFYALTGKCKYSAYTETDTACTVSFYLADVEHGVDMKVSGFTFSYDTGTCIMSIDVPVGFSQFEIELSDPCLVSCFFPPTVETIHETFDFNTKTTETLGHKLDIVRPSGLLNITKGSHMKLCYGIYLRNRDSLLLYSGCAEDTGQLSISTCDATDTGSPYGSVLGKGPAAKSSKISVMPGAALILDDSSVTCISNNSEIHVWGTLVIKKGAKLILGDGRSCSKAILMVYPGAYVLIDDEAHLEFFKIIGDTTDRHIFFISKLPSTAEARVGVAPSIESLLYTDTILDGTEVPVEICDLNTVTPTHGIANREWGFSNVLEPKAIVRIPADTLCKGECLHIDFKASLNDPIRMLEVCRIDTILGVATESYFGNKRIEGNTLEEGYDESAKCYYSEAQLQVFPLCDYLDSAKHWYKIFVEVKNHCDQSDDTTLYFYMAEKPQAAIALADTMACPGIGMVKAYNLSPVNAEKAIWHVNIVDTTEYHDGDENRFQYGGDWEVFNLHYGDSFEFPEFNWVGGFKYAISLTQFGRCGESESNWDTVEVQPGAIIIASPATVYSDPLGPGALQLLGYTGSADTWTWTPTDYLDDPYILNPIATPTDTITYILSAFKGSCEAYDTLFVKHNTLAYAGPADTVCAEERVLLGTSFDAALFLAYQYYENPTQVGDEVSDRVNTDPEFFDKLSLYFISDEGKGVLQTMSPFTLFLGSLNRTQFYEKPWFKDFFQLFHDERNYADAFSLFKDEVDNDGTLSTYILSNPMFALQALQAFLDVYNSNIHTGAASQISSTWEKYTNDLTGWENLSFWDNQIKILDTVMVSTLYKITVIDNANSKVEFDQVYIYAVQPITPQYYVMFQTDSTLYFSNQSEPIQYSTLYEWDFGDATTSTQINPIHTFPFFDSAYVICLSATNLCGTFTYCDTLRVDSSGLINYSLIRKEKENPDKEPNKSITGTASDILHLICYPNPMDNEINFAYEIGREFNEGRIEIQNCQGQMLQQHEIRSAKGRITLPAPQSSGLYFYQIILDKRVTKAGKLVKE